ncbi:MAG: penicillin-binding protein 2 [Paenibacillaceae bacterium]|jgi:penicillin-binding protein 2|nr:penicillin-binding protein 2 [Paenibacillaceae bacterium]
MKTPLGTGESERNQEARRRRTQFSVRINFFFFASFILFSTLIGKLAILQFVHGEEMAAQERVRQKANVPISPIRGNIYDSNGYPLAYTISSQSLFYQLKLDKKKEETIALAVRLADAFRQLADESKQAEQPDAAEVLKRMDTGFDLNGEKAQKAAGYSFSPRRIKTGLTAKEIAYFAEHRDEFDGIEIVEESTREYADNTIAVQLIGYLRQFSTATDPNLGKSFLDYYKNDELKKIYQGDELVGFDGLEFMYQKELRGSNGMKTYRVNSTSQIMEQVELTAPVKGNNLHLTIDKDVQLTAENAIAERLAYMKSPAARGTYAAKGVNAVAGYAVAMEVDTGRVIAMASFPDYNPNEVWDNGRISPEKWNEVRFKYLNGTIREQVGYFTDPNEYKRHPSSLVYLGSTMKPLTVLIGLNEGIIGANEIYQDPVTFYFGRDGKAKVSNSDMKNYGRLTAASAIQHSANTYMAEMIGNRMYFSKKYPAYDNPGNAVEVWDSYVKKFGLGVLTGSGLPGESEGLADYLTSAKRESSQSALIYSSFGQQGKYTTLQLAQYASMLANHGKRYKPQFVDMITTYDQDPVQTFQPELLDEVTLPDEYWRVVEQGMSKVGVQGFDGVAYSYNRKTGTSEQQVGGDKVENAVLIAYAPAEKPKLAVAVVVPEGGFGSWGAAPIARQIFDAYDQHIGLNGLPKGVVPQQ